MNRQIFDTRPRSLVSKGIDWRPAMTRFSLQSPIASSCRMSHSREKALVCIRCFLWAQNRRRIMPETLRIAGFKPQYQRRRQQRFPYK